MRRVVWIGAAVLLAGIAVWSLIDSKDSREPRVLAVESPETVAVADQGTHGGAGLTSRPLAPRSAGHEDDEPGGPLRALVVDDAGAPVEGVPVLAAVLTNGGFPMVLSSATTASDGTAGLTLTSTDERFVTSGAPWVVIASVPSASRVQAVLDFSKPLPNPIRLRLPPRGRLVVTVLDGQKQPLRERVNVELAPAGDEAFWRAMDWARTTDAGEAVFEGIGVGSVCAVRAFAVERRGMPAMTHGSGPAGAGETARVTVVLDASKPLLSGRIVDPDRKPWRDASFQALVVNGMCGTQPRQMGLRTDTGGQFRFEVREDLIAGERRRLEVAHVLQPGELDAFGAVDLTRQLAGTVDVGDVVMGPVPPLVAGMVVGDDGRPVAGARLWLRQLVQGTGKRIEDWGYVRELESPPPAGDDGRFEIRGTCTAERLQVAAYADGLWCDDPVDVPRGQQNVVVRLHFAGAIAGSVELPEGVEARRITLTATMAGEPASAARFFGSTETGLVHPDGSFKIDRLRPGAFRVTIENPDLIYPVRVDDVAVHGGGTTRDPRLQRVHLDDRGRPVFLTVVDSADRAIPDAEAAVVGTPVVGSRQRARQEMGRVRDGRIQVFARGTSAEAVVGAPGYRRKTIVLDEDQKTVVLEKGSPIRVVVTGLPDPLPEGVEVSLGLMLEQTAARHTNFRPEDFPGRGGFLPLGDLAGGTDVPVGEPGRYLVSVHMNAGKTMTRVFEDTIEIGNTPDQKFTFAAEPAALRKALAQFEAKPGGDSVK